MKRSGPSRYKLGHFDIFLESWRKWRVWDDEGDVMLDAFPTLREAGEYCRKQLELERIQSNELPPLR